MNPYWQNSTPSTDEWLHSDRVKSNFFMLITGHIVLWVISLLGIVFIYLNAQQTAPIQAFTSQGQPAWGTPIAITASKAADKQEEFLNLHLKNVVSHLFMRTEKGALPELKYYTDDTLTAILDANFGFTAKKKTGYSQAFYVKDFEKIGTVMQGKRRIYRVHGVLSSHSLDGAANSPVYLIMAVDKAKSTPENPLGWIVSVVISVDPQEFYNKERQELVNQVTQIKTTPPLKKPTK